MSLNKTATYALVMENASLPWLRKNSCVFLHNEEVPTAYVLSS